MRWAYLSEWAAAEALLRPIFTHEAGIFRKMGIGVGSPDGRSEEATAVPATREHQC